MLQMQTPACLSKANHSLHNESAGLVEGVAITIQTMKLFFIKNLLHLEQNEGWLEIELRHK